MQGLVIAADSEAGTSSNRNLRVDLGNARFSGTAVLYSDQTELHAAAVALAGFPATTEDSRDVKLGSGGEGNGGGTLDLHFFCGDSRGHGRVVATVDAGQHLLPGGWHHEAVRLVLEVDAAAVDRFVAALKSLAEGGEGVAILEAAG